MTITARPSTPTRPSRRAERSLLKEGFEVIVGLDEVGRGAWAGPVSVGVAVIPAGVSPPKGLRDSKLVPEDEREALFPRVARWCVDWSVGHAGPDECDQWGMTVALRLAAQRALAGLTCTPDIILMDGAFDYVTEPGGGACAVENTEVRTLVRGDLTCTSIAAASIVAKVTRDRMMRGLSESFPPFDFDRNKGYPSPTHQTALAGCGLTAIHRRSWAFVEYLPYR